MQPEDKDVAPTAQTFDEGQEHEFGDWMKRARSAYRGSTSYIDNNMRKNWDDSIKAFNSQHPGDSKYNSPAYEKRSRLYRPKIRSIIRKNEAAGAAAFFSNMDTTSVTADDQTSNESVAGAAIMKSILQYRLTKSIPWFMVVLGGLQDTQSIGAVCAHVYWDYKASKNQDLDNEQTESEPLKMEMAENEYPAQTESKLPPGAGVVEQDKSSEQSEAPVGQPAAGLSPSGAGPMASQLPPTMQPQAAPTAAPGAAQTPQKTPAPKPVAEKNPPQVDKPVVDLIPLENIRVDPKSNWMDPINTSPYVIHMIPMYSMDIKDKMESGEWFKYSDGMIRASGERELDTTRLARLNGRSDPYADLDTEVDDYETYWVQRHIHRRGDEDWEFYTLGDKALLTEPRLLKSVVFHGKRPYIMGCCVLETHKIYPSSLPQIARGLIDEANEVANQRIDNVKFVLNKKWFIKRGKDVDVGGLVRNVPGGVVSMDDPNNDVREISWNDVTSSAYEEQTRIDNDMSELLGNFSPAQVMADHGINGPARNMAMLSQSAGTLVEYLLRTYVETFVQPVLRQLVLLEQHYETDQTVMALAGKNAKLFQHFGVSEVTDQLLNKEITLTVNVGMGATDPSTKLNKFLNGVTGYTNIVKQAPPGMNLNEVGKEVFGHLGYQDGSRFFTTDNPEVSMLQAKLQQATQIIQQLQQKASDKMVGHQVKAQSVLATNETKKEIAANQQDNENLRAAIIHRKNLISEERQRQHERFMTQYQNGQRPMSSANQEATPSDKTKGFKIVRKKGK